jgi:nuclease S1
MIGVTLAVTAALLGQPSAAWGPLGHHAVGAVADTLLSPGARVEVARLLLDDRDRNGAPSGRTTLADVSLWADEIRGSEADRPRWHYDNMPACRAIPPRPDWCPQQQCASARIEPLLAVLGDRTRAARERNEALKWIVHLVGDLHQPLHAADYAQGATLVPVQLAGRPERTPVTLHGAWDVRLVGSALHADGSRQPTESALRALVKRARELAPALREAPATQWVLESNRLARQVALDYPGFACDSVPTQAVVLSVNYQRRAQRVIRSQLALAGARLATVLNRALARAGP